MITSSNNWKNILNNVLSGPMHDVVSYYPEMKTKDGSSLLSSVLTIEAARYFNSIGMPCVVEKTDQDPDLYFPEMNLPVEIKITRWKKNLAWMGGKYSKRKGLTLLIAWSEADSIDGRGYGFFVTSTELDTTTMNECGTEYYATKITLKEISQRIDIIGQPDCLETFVVLP